MQGEPVPWYLLPADTLKTRKWATLNQSSAVNWAKTRCKRSIKLLEKISVPGGPSPVNLLAIPPDVNDNTISIHVRTLPRGTSSVVLIGIPMYQVWEDYLVWDPPRSPHSHDCHDAMNDKYDWRRIFSSSFFHSYWSNCKCKRIQSAPQLSIEGAGKKVSRQSHLLTNRNSSYATYTEWKLTPRTTLLLVYPICSLFSLQAYCSLIRKMVTVKETPYIGG